MNPPKTLAESIERLKTRNDQLSAYLSGMKSSAADRVASAPDTSLEDATERARKYWDKLEGRSSVPPPPKPHNG